MKPIKIQRVGPLRGLIETFLLGALVLLSLLAVIDQLPANAFFLMMMYIGAGCALWYTLRLKVPEGPFLHKVGFEALNVIALGFTTMILLPLVTIPFGFWETANINAPAGFQLISCLPAYVGFRILFYGWLFWDRLRQRKLLWGMVHAQLSVVVIVTALMALLGAVVITVDANRNFPEETLVATLAHRLILTIIPFLGVATIGLATALIGILPPAALASYLYARRMIRRLESLTETASELQRGNYAARVEVSGQDELAQLQTDFNAMAADLENALAEIQAERDKVTTLLEDRRQLIASVSHELRTPLAILRGYLEPAIEKGESSISPEDLTIVHRETLRLESLVDDLFTLSQAEVDQLNLQVQPTDIGTVTQRLVEIYAPLAWGQGRVEVVAQTEAEDVSAMVDEARLEQILTNLLRNAIRHTPPGGIVAIMLSNMDEWVQLEVRDTGEGIAPQDLPYIWERFYRGSEGSPTQGSGAGLGLALVKELTEAMGGSVDVESTLGDGSVFTVLLPKG
jgi:signal transduction histidine kinase